MFIPCKGRKPKTQAKKSDKLNPVILDGQTVFMMFHDLYITKKGHVSVDSFTTRYT